jgi:hypothetical protein
MKKIPAATTMTKLMNRRSDIEKKIFQARQAGMTPAIMDQLNIQLELVAIDIADDIAYEQAKTDDPDGSVLDIG